VSKHTPGPWRLVWWGNENYPFPLTILADNDGMWIARDGTASSEANARLIAAAPDMWAALQAYAYAATLPYNDPLHEGFLRDADEKRRAAIAKVEGSQP
jgi:hypothetical protein